MAGHGVLSEIQEAFVGGVGEMGLAVQHGDGTGVFGLVRVQAGDQLVERFQIGVIARLLEGINDHRVYLAARRGRGFVGNGHWLIRRFGRRRGLHNLIINEGGHLSRYF